MGRAAFLDRDGVVNRLVYHKESGVIDNPLNAAQFRLNVARAYPKTALFDYCKQNDLFAIKDTENLLIFQDDAFEANIKTPELDP